MITKALTWVLAAVVAIPIAVLTHESGHALAYLAFGFPEVALHYDSSTHALEEQFWSLYRAGSLQAAGEIVAPWKVGAASAAGLVVTYATVLAGCIVVVRACHPVVVTVVLAANLRALPVAVSMMLTWDSRTLRGTDEAHVAAITGIPELALVVLGVTSLFGSAVWMFRRVPKSERALSVASSIVGLVTGMGLYLVAGPRILLESREVPMGARPKRDARPSNERIPLAAVRVAADAEGWTDSGREVRTIMNWILGAFVATMVPIHAFAGEPPSPMESPADPGPAILKLTSSVDRLARLLEKDLASRAEEGEARRVEVAVAVIGLRYRKIDRLETEIQQISRDEDESAPAISRMTTDVEQLRTQGRAESGALTEEAKAALAEIELRIRFEEDRIARLRERKSVLQNEVSTEQRRLAGLEAILDSWMQKQ